MKVYMHCIHQDAIEKKAEDKKKKKKQEAVAATKKALIAKKNAKSVVDSLTNPMMLFEEETNKLETAGPSYLLDSAKMLLARVKAMVVSATHHMTGTPENQEDGIVWDMEEVKLAKVEMITKMRNLYSHACNPHPISYRFYKAVVTADATKFCCML